MIGRVFVYGTLKPGQCRWSALAPFALPSSLNHSVSPSGALFDSGWGWPAAAFGDRWGDHVPGIIVDLRPDSVDDALSVLDEIEGVASGLFERVSLEVESRLCWAYQWLGATDGLQRIAGWPPDPG